MNTKQFKELQTYRFKAGKKHLFTVISITKYRNRRGTIKIKYQDKIQECLLHNTGELEYIWPIINTSTTIMLTSEMIYNREDTTQ